MRFSSKKLPEDAASSLRKVPIELFDPYVLMLAPVYVYLSLNRKFVAVKGPLGVFQPVELEKYRALEYFYLPAFVDHVAPFQAAGKAVRHLLAWVPTRKMQTNEDEQEVTFSTASYELNDAILRTIGPLWSPEGSIEPFFLTVFAEETCGKLPPETVIGAQEKSIEQFEFAILRSSWAVFLALHVGHCNFVYLNRLRERVFRETLDLAPRPANGSETDQLIAVVYDSFPHFDTRTLGPDSIRSRSDRVAAKFLSRFRRITSRLLRSDLPKPSIFGAGGFVDV